MRRYTSASLARNIAALIHKTTKPVDWGRARSVGAKEGEAKRKNARQIECKRFFFIIRLQQWMVNKFCMEWAVGEVEHLARRLGKKKRKTSRVRCRMNEIDFIWNENCMWKADTDTHYKTIIIIQ